MLANIKRHTLKYLYTLVVTLIFISCNQDKKKESNATENPVATQTVIEEKDNSTDSQITYEIGNVQVKLTQTKSDGTTFYCKSNLVSSINNKIIDSISFNHEPVGGYYGISIPVKIENHLVFTKHGDYDGRTILINESGEISNIIGGKNYYDSESNLLFTQYYSDLSGFAVFNLKSDSLVLEMSDIEDEPISFHKAFGERYFILSSNYETDESKSSIWEIEFDLERIMQVDLDTSQINATNVLKTWELEDVNCECDKQ